jgi:hypothetical protein
MYVPFSLFVIVIVVVLIFWELSKINGRLIKASVPSMTSRMTIKIRNPENRWPRVGSEIAL